MKTALVTGASRGIGLNLVKVLNDQRYKVYAVTREPSAELTSLEKGGRVVVIQANISERPGIIRVAQNLEGQPLDLLFNNAGVMLGGSEKFEDLNFSNLTESLHVNLQIPMELTQALMKSLLKSSHPVVAHITSKMGSIQDNSSGGYYAYRISKTALNMFNKSFSVDYPQIVSMVLHPGWVQTEMGGANAPVTPEESAMGLFQIADRATLKESGKFYAFNGEAIPW